MIKLRFTRNNYYSIIVTEKSLLTMTTLKLEIAKTLHSNYKQSFPPVTMDVIFEINRETTIDLSNEL